MHTRKTKHGNSKEILAFIVAKDAAWPAELWEVHRLTVAVDMGQWKPELRDEVTRNVEKLREFKDWLRDRAVCATFSSLDNLRAEVERSLREWRNRHPELAEVSQVVFVSSTVEDLKQYREAARDAALRAGVRPDMQEYFVASGNAPLDECLAKVSAADVVVAIVAHRYGWVPRDQPGRDSKSITWLECEAATQASSELSSHSASHTSTRAERTAPANSSSRRSWRPARSLWIALAAVAVTTAIWLYSEYGRPLIQAAMPTWADQIVADIGESSKHQAATLQLTTKGGEAIPVIIVLLGSTAPLRRQGGIEAAKLVMQIEETRDKMLNELLKYADRGTLQVRCSAYEALVESKDSLNAAQSKGVFSFMRDRFSYGPPPSRWRWRHPLLETQQCASIQAVRLISLFPNAESGPILAGIASGHPDSDVRKQAKLVLDNMRHQ